jgi:hypothetical protein
LLVRADIVLGKGRASDRRTYRRWRRILHDALPSLLGCERICPKAEKVRLRGVLGQGEASFSGWVRLTVQRRPGRKRVRKLLQRLRRRLEENLLLVGGQVVKFGVRRCRGKAVVQDVPVVQPVREEGQVEPGPIPSALPPVVVESTTAEVQGPQAA